VGARRISAAVTERIKDVTPNADGARATKAINDAFKKPPRWGAKE
jgi:hypothetical protein